MTYVNIDWAFSKGFIGWYNQIAVPAQYSTYLRNCRIENESIVMRDGFRAYTSIGALWRYRQLKNVGGQLYALIQEEWTYVTKLYHLLPSNYYNLGTVGDNSTRILNKDDIDIVPIWDMALILAKGKNIQYSINGQPVAQLESEKRVNVDWWTAIDRAFSSCMWAYYSSNVFINEIQKETRTHTDPDTGETTTGYEYKKTNRVIVSHFVNMDVADWRDEARNFSAQKDADDLEIPYKIVCPTTVTGIVGTMQNLYIFCEDSIQYLDQTILQEYRNNKILRSVPIANGYQLDNHHLCAAAGNFVFFFSRDKHIRSIWYTSGIYDPQIADLTDTEFGIQRWINDNIADDQSQWFAFFNKKDQTIEFHLTSKKAYARSKFNEFCNDITLIRDLQHQSWLIDTWKYFGAMENFNRSWTATWTYTTPTRYDDWTEQPEDIEQSGVANVVAWGTGFAWYRPTTQDLTQQSILQKPSINFYYQTEDKYDTTFVDRHWEIEITVHPIEFEYDTVNIWLTGKKFDVAEMKLFSGLRLTGAINIHAGNWATVYVPQEGQEITYDWKFRGTVYIEGVQQCMKEMEWHNIYDYYKRYQIEVWGPDLKDYDPQDRNSVLDYDRMMFPFDLILDQSMVRKKGKRIRVKIECATPGADLYLSGLSIEATPLWHFDLADKY